MKELTDSLQGQVPVEGNEAAVVCRLDHVRSTRSLEKRKMSG